MKRFVFTLVLLCAISCISFAQGSLQFNQAVNKAATNVASATFTVPAGKVWKLTSFSAHTGRPAFCDQTQVTYYLKVDNALICGNIDGFYSSTCSASCGSTSTKGSSTQTALWFPENTVIEIGFMGGLHNASCSSLSFNGLEFNVIP